MIADYSSLPATLLAAVDAAISDAATADASRGLVIASDFDGVLAPLLDNPEDSRMTDSSAAAIAKISMHLTDSVHLALVSGRPLGQLFELAAPPSGTHLIGSHGAEQGVVTNGVLVRQDHALSPAQAANLATVAEQAEALAGTAQGAWVEHKPAAAVLHTRLAHPDDATRINAELLAFCARLDVFAMAGKDVIEVAVQQANKGQSLGELKRELRASHVLYFGDDVTDETVFVTLGTGDVGVKVGDGDTAAGFRVRTVDHISLLLSYIADKVIQDC